MATPTRKSSRRRGLVALGTVLCVPLAYYGGHLLLRSPPGKPVQLIAHRGGPRHAPEDTLAAFRTAIDQGASWQEFDVRMTRDGELVVIHDETVDRTTDGTGAVRDLTLAQIRTLDAGGGERVPTFAEVVDLARTHRVGILPETKSAHLYPGVEEKLLQALVAADYLDRTVVQSFEAMRLFGADGVMSDDPAALAAVLAGR